MNKYWIYLILIALLPGCVSLGDQRYIVSKAKNQSLESEFSLTSWNIYKGDQTDFDRAQLSRLIRNNDITCIQEYESGLISSQSSDVTGIFARSFEGLFRKPNGVATFSKTQPSWSKSIMSRDKEFGLTPKMILLATYPIANEKLLVANIHALNFETNYDNLEFQMRQLAEELQKHSGPSVICGDFNTWKENRLDIVNKILKDENQFQPVELDSDNRVGGSWFTLFLGGNRNLPLDHIYIKGLSSIRAKGLNTAGSDHQPLKAVLRLTKTKSSVEKCPIISLLD